MVVKFPNQSLRACYPHRILDNQDSFSLPPANIVPSGRPVQVRTWVSLESAVPLSWGKVPAGQELGAGGSERKGSPVEGSQGPGGGS